MAENFAARGSYEFRVALILLTYHHKSQDPREIALITGINQPSIEFMIERMRSKRMIREGKLVLGVRENADEGTVTRAMKRVIAAAAQ